MLTALFVLLPASSSPAGALALPYLLPQPAGALHPSILDPWAGRSGLAHWSLEPSLQAQFPELTSALEESLPASPTPLIKPQRETTAPLSTQSPKELQCSSTNIYCRFLICQAQCSVNLQSHRHANAGACLPLSLRESLRLLWSAWQFLSWASFCARVKGSGDGLAQRRPCARPGPHSPATVCSTLSVPQLLVASHGGHFSSRSRPSPFFSHCLDPRLCERTRMKAGRPSSSPAGP